MTKVSVDKNICIGCGFCAANLDTVFKMDEDDLATTEVLEENLSEETKEEIKDIAEGCPVDAITVSE